MQHSETETITGQAPPVQGQVLVLIPAYNEERFIGSVVLKARQYASQVLVVDDGSSDATRELAEAAGALVVSHAQNRGKGAALTTGFHKARGLAPDVLVTLDADWQHMPEQIAQVAGPVLRGEADIVVGSRYLGDSSEVPRARVVGHRGFTAVGNALSGIALTDSQSGYRAFSRKALETLEFSSSSFSVESEMQFLAGRHHLRMIEVPITIRYRDAPKRPVLVHGFNVLNGLLSLVARHRPLLFFGLPGAASLLVGLVLGLFAVHGFNVHQELPVGTTLLVVIFLLAGIFFIFTGIILWAMRSLLDDLKRYIGHE